MSEKNGFRNCPEITEFQRGMEIVRNPYPARRIVSVDALGEGLMDNAVYIHPHDKSEWTLKLDGLWERQVRRHVDGVIGTVLTMSDDWVGYVLTHSGTLALAERMNFLLSFPDVVLPEPIQVGAAVSECNRLRDLLQTCEAAHKCLCGPLHRMQVIRAELAALLQEVTP